MTAFVTDIPASENHAMIGMSDEDIAKLRVACDCLEHPSLAARLTSVVGTPIEVGLSLLPRRWFTRLQSIAEDAIGKALESALASMRREHEISAHESYYKALTAGSGALSGLFGVPGLLLELPVTTTLMLRSIAEIARDHGEDIHDESTRNACLEVFALGGRTEMDDAADTGYYGVRLALTGYVSLTSYQVTHQTILSDGSPLLVQLIQAVAARFGRQLSSQAAARMLPVISAIGSAAINTIFMQHFQDMARGHFTVRQLERKYGEALVRSNYERIANELK